MEEMIAKELDLAEQRAIESLARYKFQMFGYWAGVWVHLNRLSGGRRANPFRRFVTEARNMVQGVEHGEVGGLLR